VVVHQRFGHAGSFGDPREGQGVAAVDTNEFLGDIEQLSVPLRL
jgi:hypothetical protein